MPKQEVGPRLRQGVCGVTQCNGWNLKSKTFHMLHIASFNCCAHCKPPHLIGTPQFLAQPKPC